MVAEALGLSEASVKQMFSRRDFTIQRLEDVCRAAGIEFGELAHEVTAEDAGMAHLTVEQEQEIVSDPALMLVPRYARSATGRSSRSSIPTPSRVLSASAA